MAGIILTRRSLSPWQGDVYRMCVRRWRGDCVGSGAWIGFVDVGVVLPISPGWFPAVDS